VPGAAYTYIKTMRGIGGVMMLHAALAVFLVVFEACGTEKCITQTIVNLRFVTANEPLCIRTIQQLP